jgi:protein-tyrosine phosphatase
VSITKRRIPLEGSPNFRDIGGHPALNGNQVTCGEIFRSGHLAHLTDKDQEILNSLSIRTVCDFRSKEEIKHQPNRLPNGGSIQYLRLPIVNESMEPTRAVEKIMRGDIEWFTDDFMVNAYIEKVDKFHHVWNQFFKYISQKKSRPLVFHCTAGKDRTGVGAALILSSLGVSDKWIIHDHGLSNRYNAEQINTIRKSLQKIGIDAERLTDYLTAPKSAIIALLDHIRKTYGTAADYLLHKAKVKKSWLEKLREDLLE